MAPVTPSYRLADHLLGGDLAKRLGEWRKPNHRGKPDRSYQWISDEIARLTDGKLVVSHATIRNWLVSEETAA